MGKYIFSCALVVRSQLILSQLPALQSTKIKEHTNYSISAAKEEISFHVKAILGKVHHEKIQQLISIFSFARTPGQKYRPLWVINRSDTYKCWISNQIYQISHLGKISKSCVGSNDHTSYIDQLSVPGLPLCPGSSWFPTPCSRLYCAADWNGEISKGCWAK